MSRVTETGSAGDERARAKALSLIGLSEDRRGEGRADNATSTQPPIDLFRVFICPEARDAVVAVMTPDANGRTYIGQGPQVDAFESEFAQFVGSKEPILTLNSCTSALTLALHLCGVGPDDWVCSTPMTCSATNTPILNLHANVLWADVDSLSGHLTAKGVRSALQAHYRKGLPEPKAIMAVDWAGAPCDYEALYQFGIPIIEDAAHRVFALDNPHGHMVCWSFQAIKHLTTIDGGALLVPPDMYRRAKLLRWYGLDRESKADFRCSQDISEAGYKFHMNDVAAAIGRANLKHTRRIVEAHRKNAYAMGSTNYQSDHWFYATHVENRDAFKVFMKGKGIDVSPVHRRNDEFSCFAAYRGDLPGLDAFTRTYVGLPCGWWITANDICRIQEAMTEWMAR